MSITITRDNHRDTITVTNQFDVTVTTKPVNPARTGWGFHAHDAHRSPIRLTSGTLRTNLTEATAIHHASRLAEWLGDAGTRDQRRADLLLHRSRY